MRVGVDARELCGRPTGVGRYLAGLIEHFARDPRTERHEFLLYAPGPVSLGVHAGRFPVRVVEGPAGSWWEQVRVIRAASADRLDVWFAPGYTAPLRLSVPIVAAIHDLSFVAHPEWFRVREGIRRRWLTRQTAARARAVITISEFSKREIVERLGVPAARVRVIPPGITLPARPQASRSDGARLLFVGSIFNRRHLPQLIRAFAAIARSRRDAVLDIVGDNRTYPYEDLRRIIESEAMQQRVRWREYITDAELSELYARARAFAFLSEYEGLGLTPLEALLSGVPPVLADTAVARESCGDAALYVPPADVGAIARALETLLFDSALRARLLDAAPAVLARYSWPRAARETLDVLEAAL